MLWRRGSCRRSRGSHQFGPSNGGFRPRLDPSRRCAADLTHYNWVMKIVSPTELRKHLSRHLRMVRSGEEIIVVSRGEPLARILPIPCLNEHDRKLVASGLMRPRLKKMTPAGWKRFWAMPAPNLSQGEAVRAVLEEREESR